jgi:hypothetical protein
VFQKLDDSPLNPGTAHTLLEFSSNQMTHIRVVVKADVDRAAFAIRRAVVLNPGSSRTAE